MEQHVRQALVLQTVLLMATGVFARPLPDHGPATPAGSHSAGIYRQHDCFYSGPDFPDQSSANFPVTASRSADEDTLVNNGFLSAKLILTERLVSFHATYERNSVNLCWNINAVNYASQFDIERSLDGINFEKVGEAKHTDMAAHEYSFVDDFKASLARKNDLYYRLKQNDAQNAAVYSKVLIVRTYNSRSLKAISVTPDPSVNDIEVNVQLKESSYVVMKVTDSHGDEILRKSIEADSGDHKYALSGTSKLHAGDYTLEIVVNSNERMTLKLIKG